MHLLLIHQNFPGQFRELAPAWLGQGHQITAIGSAAHAPDGEAWQGLRYLSYQFAQDQEAAPTEPTPLQRGQAVAQLCKLVLSEPAPPQLVLAHSGWGEALFLRRSLGSVPLVVYPELWASPKALGLGFDSDLTELLADLANANRFPLEGLEPLLKHQNLVTELALSQAEAAVVPSVCQLQGFPEPWQPRLTVIHEGVDTERLRPDPNAKVKLSGRLTLQPGDPIVTLVSRQLEPLRGLRSVMKAWPLIAAEHPTARLLLVGGTEQGYGLERPLHSSHLEDALSSLPTPGARRRIHTLGRVPYAELVAVLQCSACHLGLSYPYTLSWSLTEAMSCGAPIITNHGSPLADCIQHRDSGYLVDFNDPEALASNVLELLQSPQQRHTIGQRGRQTVIERFSMESALNGYETLLEDLLARR